MYIQPADDRKCIQIEIILQSAHELCKWTDTPYLAGDTPNSGRDTPDLSGDTSNLVGDTRFRPENLDLTQS
jgi:hypothetical protein